MDYSLPGSSIHGILQARILGWVAIPFSRGSSRPRDQTQVSCTASRFFTIWATREAFTFYHLFVRLTVHPGYPLSSLGFLVPWVMAELDERLYLGGRERDGLKGCVCLFFSPWRCLGKRSWEAWHGAQLWLFPWRQMLSPNLESGSCWERECPGDPALMS